jgi:hypothetical protein
MKFKLIDSPPRSMGGKRGFVCAIEIDKNCYGWHSANGGDAWRAIITTCQERLGKQYKVMSKRPGKYRKWFVEERRTFTRFYFKSSNVRMLVMLDL